MRDFLDLRSPALRHSHAVNLAHPITNQDQRIVKTAQIITAGGVRKMVRDRNELVLPIRTAEMLSKQFKLHLRREHLLVLAQRVLICFEGYFVWLVRKSMSHIFNA